MAQVASEIDAVGAPDLAPCDSTRDKPDEFSRTAFAVNDAGTLVDALGAKLGWLGQTLATGNGPDESRHQLREAVEVCVQLTRLLGGALGTCRQAANTTRSTAAVDIRTLLECALDKARLIAESAQIAVGLVQEVELSVITDGELMRSAVDGALDHALHATPTNGAVRVSAGLCGAHVVITLTCSGGSVQVPPSRVQQIRASSIRVERQHLAVPEALRRVSAQLIEQGGYIDIEHEPTGDVSVYVVVPTTSGVTVASMRSGTPLASETDSLRQIEPVPGQKRSEKMIVNSDRFGAIEVDVGDVLRFPAGIIGFPRDNEFVLVRKPDSQIIGWLQSAQTSYLTLPVVSAHVLAPRFPDVPIESYSERVGLGSNIEELALLVVLSAPPGQPATVNLMAPIIVNAATRTGAQVLLEDTRFTTRELFVIPPEAEVVTPTEQDVSSDAQSATSAAE